LQIEGVLAYLKDDLGLEGDDLHQAVKKFPEVINLNVEMRLKANIQHMQKVWHPPCSTLVVSVCAQQMILTFCSVDESLHVKV